jgi:hypothetical protein
MWHNSQELHVSHDKNSQVSPPTGHAQSTEAHYMLFHLRQRFVGKFRSTIPVVIVVQSTSYLLPATALTTP